MRTTIILPDELYRQVKERVRREDRTVTSFLEEALRRALAESDGVERPDFVVEPYRPKVRGVRPGVDLNSNAALEDLMDEDDVEIQRRRAEQAART